MDAYEIFGHIREDRFAGNLRVAIANEMILNSLRLIGAYMRQ